MCTCGRCTPPRVVSAAFRKGLPTNYNGKGHCTGAVSHPAGAQQLVHHPAAAPRACCCRHPRCVPVNGLLACTRDLASHRRRKDTGARIERPGTSSRCTRRSSMLLLWQQQSCTLRGHGHGHVVCNPQVGSLPAETTTPANSVQDVQSTELCADHIGCPAPKRAPTRNSCEAGHGDHESMEGSLATLLHGESVFCGLQKTSKKPTKKCGK